MNKIIITIIAVSMLYPASNTVDVNSKEKKPTIIDRIETTDADAQIEIDRLKKEFERQREQIHQKYDLRKQTLKKQQKQEMELLLQKQVEAVEASLNSLQAFSGNLTLLEADPAAGEGMGSELAIINEELQKAVREV